MTDQERAKALNERLYPLAKWQTAEQQALMLANILADYAAIRAAAYEEAAKVGFRHEYNDADLYGFEARLAALLSRVVQEGEAKLWCWRFYNLGVQINAFLTVSIVKQAYDQSRHGGTP